LKSINLADRTEKSIGLKSISPIEQRVPSVTQLIEPVGQWEGDTFVVQTAGFKEGSWLDNNGHPHTEALRTTERFRRVNFGHMEVDVTIDDPKAYSRPWKSDTMRFTLQPDTELLEHLCENNRDLPVLERYWRGQEQAGTSTKGKQ